MSFPSFNFPYTSCEDSRQFLVDYGRTGPVHVFKNEQNVECIPQKKEINKNTMVRLISEKPTLPLNFPDINICDDVNHEAPLAQIEKQLQCEQAVTNFTSDYGSVVFGGLAEEVGHEAAAQSWRPTSCRLKRLAKFDPVIKRLQNDFCDTPTGLLTDLLQECDKEEKLDATGKYYSNCLAHDRSTSDIVLVYPGGRTMNEMCVSQLEIGDEEGLSVKLSARTGRFSLPDRICEVSVGNDQDGIIAVRTHHQCWLFGCESSDDFWTPRFLGNLQCKSTPCAITVSPYIPEEVIVAMETGSLWLWNGEDSSVEVVRQCSSCVPQEFDWYFTEFASHPRQVVRGNQTNVQLIDLRGSSTSKDLMTLPSSHFFPDDKFTAIQRCHDNPYHYILATTQSLAVLDMRFQQNPVLKWCHSLQYPVKHINVLPYPTAEDVLVFVGSYKKHDVHCFQYCHGENWNRPLGMLDDSTSVLPPRSTSNPWKVSSYNDWPQMINYPNKAQSYSKVCERLNQPLLGLTCVPHSTRKSLTVIQLSNTGDLFYQNLSSHEIKLEEVRDGGRVQYYQDVDLDLTSSGGCGSKRLTLEENDHKFITKWVECLMEHSNNERKDMGEYFDKNCDSEDVGMIREELFSYLTEFNVQCSLCSDRGSCDNPEASEVCRYCKMPSQLSDRIKKTYQPMQVLTRKSLGLKNEAERLQLFNKDIKCSEPLGSVLLRNWFSDEQVPIELTGEKSSDDTKQDMVETWLRQAQTPQ